jgi:hypothetical protein
MQQMIFIAAFIACSTCFGHHYAHHQELNEMVFISQTRVFIIVLNVLFGPE